MPNPAPNLTIGALVGGKYRIERLLGKGGMGAVYLAKNVALGRPVALKLLLADLARDPLMLQRFRQEARAAAAIGHPGIVDVLDLGEAEDGAPFIVMEWLDGETLGQRLESAGRLPIEEARRVGDGILDALGAAHAKGIVHRDLKPDNVFLVARPEARVKLLDYGLSKLQGDDDLHLTQSGMVIGTPLYMAPEQARGLRDIGPPVDVYSTGALLYHALAGEPPFSGQTFAEVIAALLTAEPRPLGELRPDAPPGLAALIARMLAKEPTARPDTRTARQLLDGALQGAAPAALAETMAPGASPSTSSPPPTTVGSMRRWYTLAVFAVAAIAVSIARPSCGVHINKKEPAPTLRTAAPTPPAQTANTTAAPDAAPLATKVEKPSAPPTRPRLRVAPSKPPAQPSAESGVSDDDLRSNDRFRTR